jgi:hypothetical protein
MAPVIRLAAKSNAVVSSSVSENQALTRAVRFPT